MGVFDATYPPSDAELRFRKKKTCAKRKTMELFLVKVFTEGKKVVGKAFLFKKRFRGD